MVYGQLQVEMLMAFMVFMLGSHNAYTYNKSLMLNKTPTIRQIRPLFHG